VKPFPGMTVRENVVIGSLFGKEKRPKHQDGLSGATVDRVCPPPGLSKCLGGSDQYLLSEANGLRLRHWPWAQYSDLDEVMAGLNTKDIEEMMALSPNQPGD